MVMVGGRSGIQPFEAVLRLLAVIHRGGKKREDSLESSACDNFIRYLDPNRLYSIIMVIWLIMVEHMCFCNHSLNFFMLKIFSYKFYVRNVKGKLYNTNH